MPISGHGSEGRFVVTAEARRRWSRDEKLAIVGEIAGSTVCAVARRHNIAPSLLFRWKRELGGATASELSEAGFVRVALPARISSPESDAVLAQDASDGKIEIVLSPGRRVVVGKGADIAMVRQILTMLEPR